MQIITTGEVVQSTNLDHIIGDIVYQSLAWDCKCLNSDDMSMLPPLITQHTRFPLNLSSFSTAATTVADDGSITIFIRYNTSWVAATI